MSEIRMANLPALGGVLCLDFVNTVDPRHAPGRLEYLADYQDLIRWSFSAGVCDAVAAEQLLARAQTDQPSARKTHRRAIRLRESLYPLLAPASRGSPLAAGSLEIFNAELRHAVPGLKLTQLSSGYDLNWSTLGEPDSVLAPIAWSAFELLQSAKLTRVRECAGVNCGWLYLDTSKAGKRRWCSMAICGNRAKAERFRRRAASPD